jgi:8-oxo-dGTP pyrophosphatase MutT (NUDIX family)
MKIKKKILAIIYRKRNKGIEFLALRNNPTDIKYGGDHYFVVTGGVEKNETLEDAVKREIDEETGIKNFIKITDLDKICEYTCEGEAGFLCKEAEFLVEVDDEVSHLSEEHLSYKWLGRDAFVKLIAWNDKNDLNLILNKLNKI